MLIPGGAEIFLFSAIKLHPQLFWQAIAVATLGNVLAGMTTYWIGRLLPEGKSLPDKAKRWLSRIHDYGQPIMLIAWAPWLGEAICVAAGFLDTARVTQGDCIAGKAQGVVLQRASQRFGRMLKCIPAGIDRDRVILAAGGRARLIDAASAVFEHGTGNACLRVLLGGERCNLFADGGQALTRICLLCGSHPRADVRPACPQLKMLATAPGVLQVQEESSCPNSL